VGFLVDEDTTSPAYWGTDLLEKFPKRQEDSPVGAQKLSYTDLLKGLLAGTDPAPYLTYSGSFTTPPCTEKVTWLVNQKIAKMSNEHISKLTAAMGVNNRPVMPLNDRTIKSSA